MTTHTRTRWPLGLLVGLLIGLAPACSRSAPEPEPEAELPGEAVTIWSDRTELFMEYPALVAGADARFAIHLTDLATFAPLREGRVVVRFEGETIQRFETAGPATPGIFGVDVKVPAARRYQVAVEVHGENRTDELRVGAVTVYPDDVAARAAVTEDEEGATSFLKEQQWTLDFATMTVDRTARRQVVSVPGTIEPRTGGSVEVRAPSAGRISAAGGFAVGASISQGTPLVELLVRHDRLGEAPVRRLELAQAESELRVAQEEATRVERLTSAGAIPQRRLVEARAQLEAARSRVRIAQEELRQLELSRTGEGAGDAADRVVIRSPLHGVIAAAGVTPGATVEAGDLLYRVVALDRVFVVGHIAEQHLARVAGSTSAEVVVPGLDAPLATSRLVSIGRVVDPATRTVPVTFELDRPPAGLAIGQGVTLRLLTPTATEDLSVPANAIVDDGGQSIVFVQKGGESFERRPVRLGGPREGGFVQVAGGLEAGDRIVTRGGHLVRLAALSPQTPGHGHVH